MLSGVVLFMIVSPKMAPFRCGEFTHINDENIANVPLDVCREFVLVEVHSLEPLLGNDLVFLQATELQWVLIRNSRLILLNSTHMRGDDDSFSTIAILDRVRRLPGIIDLGIRVARRHGLVFSH